jgi:mannose/cellobiose epimerase-like protein (N-acyl-D-glucosamine 2-epimerase family)
MTFSSLLSIAMIASLSALACAQAAVAQDSPGPTRENYLRIADEVEKSLQNDDLKKFFPAAVDPRGGFFENFAVDWTHVSGAGRRADNTRSVVYQSRLTWLAAQAARRYPAESAAFLSYARHGARFLADKQWDTLNGGFWWSVDVNGKVVRADEKHIYGNAFAIYALAAAYQATGDQADLDLAQKAFRWMDSRAHDEIHGGYFEQLRTDGSHVLVGGNSIRGNGDLLGAKPGQKSMNSHIHLLEALTGLLQVWPDDLVRKRTEEIYKINLTKIYADPGYLHLFFSPDWTPAVDRDSYGHDIESAFLFSEAAAALGRPDEPACWDAARKIVDHCLAVGYDPQSGSLNSEGSVDGTGQPDRSRVWWVQAESLNALLLMHQRYGAQDPRYWTAFVRQWDFIKAHQIDHKNGGWFNTLNPDNTPARSKMAKTDAWTEGYHQGRSMLNVVERLRKLADGN